MAKKNNGWKAYRGITKKSQIVAPSCVGGGDSLIYHTQWWFNIGSANPKKAKAHGNPKKKAKGFSPSLSYLEELSRPKSKAYKRAEEIMKNRAEALHG